MLSQPDFTQSQPRTYEQIGHRIKELISDPRVQRLQSITVTRMVGEGWPEWRQLMNEIANTHGVLVERLEGDTFRIGWREYCDA